MEVQYDDIVIHTGTHSCECQACAPDAEDGYDEN